MSLQKTLSRATIQRLPTIKSELLKKHNQEQIAKECKVSRRTIIRDIQAWTRTDDFISWIREVWLDKYGKVSDKEAFRQATKIMIATLTRRMEVKEEIQVEEKVSFTLDEMPEDEREFCRRIARNYIKRNDKTRPSSIH